MKMLKTWASHADHGISAVGYASLGCGFNVTLRGPAQSATGSPAVIHRGSFALLRRLAQLAFASLALLFFIT
jgi:hypothetical protein